MFLFAEVEAPVEPNCEGCEGSGPWLYLGGVFKMFLMVALQTYQNDSW